MAVPEQPCSPPEGLTEEGFDRLTWPDGLRLSPGNRASLWVGLLVHDGAGIRLVTRAGFAGGGASCAPADQD